MLFVQLLAQAVPLESHLNGAHSSVAVVQAPDSQVWVVNMPFEQLSVPHGVDIVSQEPNFPGTAQL